jgi:Predicted transcriptional regulators
MELKDKIVYLRNSHKMTQNDFAKKLFVSRQTITKWESGESLPTIDNIKAISELFKISVDELLDLDIDTKRRRNVNLFTDISVIFVLLCSVTFLIFYFYFVNANNDINHQFLYISTDSIFILAVFLLILFLIITFLVFLNLKVRKKK